MIDWLLAADIYLTLGGWSDHSDSGYEFCKSGVCEDVDYNEKHNAVIIDIEGLGLLSSFLFLCGFGQRTQLETSFFAHAQSI